MEKPLELARQVCELGEMGSHRISRVRQTVLARLMQSSDSAPMPASRVAGGSKKEQWCLLAF